MYTLSDKGLRTTCLMSGASRLIPLENVLAAAVDPFNNVLFFATKEGVFRVYIKGWC